MKWKKAGNLLHVQWEDQSCIVFIRFTFYAENWECFIIFGHVATNTIQNQTNYFLTWFAHKSNEQLHALWLVPKINK